MTGNARKFEAMAGNAAAEGQVIGYVCKYTPIEIFAGFGMGHSFMLPNENSFDYADSRMWPSMCGYAKSVMQHVHGGGYESVVFTDCCDALKRVSDLMRADCGKPAVDRASGAATPAFVIGLPRVICEESIRAYAQNLMTFIREYEVHSGMAFDVRRFADACAKTTAPEALSAAAPVGAGYVALLGARAPKSLTERASALCALPVRDLTCASHERSFADSESGDLALDERLIRYAGRLLAQTPCMRMSDNGARAALSGDPNIKAIIYHTIQFCDFYGFEYAGLGTKKIPSLKIETDYSPSSSGQLETRLQAFFESNGLLAEKVQEDKNVKNNNYSLSAGDEPIPRASDTYGARDADNARDTDGARDTDSTKGADSARDSYYAGIDCGSTSTNAVIVDAGGTIVASVTVPTGANGADAARRAMDEAAGGIGGAEMIAWTVATGYGRASVPFAADDVTEITCHARGVHELFRGLPNEARTVIDIGGQDSKVIRIGADAGVAEFSMNDKCAAGTGRFLELMAATLGMELGEMASAGLHPKERVDISSMCAVFAESEVISLIAGGKARDDIVWGVNLAIAGRVASMAARLGARPPYVMTGGVAKNAGVVKALELKLTEQSGGAKAEVTVPKDPQICGALGAAHIAREKGKR
ncbi:MAG: acyl-CoA dehydratase activase [Clostridiales Family XIII bacterium]|jgi:predicted CoA-substrate-specific enzyme activase|nr:acyl-CoA dehydratase activase [Clostridiales Family XIII bacterium]